MKKVFITAIASIVTPNAFADFLGVHGSIATWQSTFSGEIAGTAKRIEREGKGWSVPTFAERGFDTNSQLFGFIAFEHPIPLLPNIRIGMSKIADEGTSPEEIVTRSIDRGIINGQPITTELYQNIYTQLNINALDTTLYYEVLDNWVNLDLGLTIRQMSGEFIENTYAELLPPSELGVISCGTIDLVTALDGNCIIPPLSQTTDIDFIVPMIYAEARFDLPFSGFYAGGRTNFIAYSGNKVIDIELEAGYMFDLTAIELGIAVGYRTSSLKADDLEGLYSDAKLDGYYASMNFHF